MAEKKILKGKTFAVTGAAGFIGSTLSDRILRLGGRVLAIDNMSSGYDRNYAHNMDIPVTYNAVKTAGLDLVTHKMGKKIPYCIIHKDAQDSSLYADLKKFNVECVFHLAANAGVATSFDDPVGTNHDNAVATLNMLECSEKAGVKRFVLASSSSVYGGSDGRAVKESDELSPMSPYALQKIISENYCSFYSKVYSIDTVALRYFNVFGPRQSLRSKYSAVIPSFCSSYLSFNKNKSAIIYGDGTQYRDFCFVDNVVDANILAATHEGAFKGSAYNIACGSSYTINDLVREIGLTKVKYEKKRVGDVHGSLANISKAKNDFGYNPKVSFEKGIKITMRWYLENQIWKRS